MTTTSNEPINPLGACGAGTNPSQIDPQSAFTPGPWTIWQLAPDSDSRQLSIITTQDGEQEICGIVECDANARLIAAAPELYKVVMYAAEEITDILHDETTILQDVTADLLKTLLPMLNRVIEKVGEEANHD